jgi:hypothetical protein
VVSAEQLPPQELADHSEAVAAARALQWGIGLTLLCTAFLASAVAATWYAPPRKPPALLVRQGPTTWCGVVKSASHGTVVLSVDGESTTIDLAKADFVRPVTSCPPSG